MSETFIEDKEMSFWDHLDELRWTIARIAVIWIILAIGFFIAMPYIFDQFILGPCHHDFVFYKVLYAIGETFNLHDDFFTSPFDITLQSINIAAPFFIHLTTSFILAIVVTVPYLLWEIWKFIRPALYENEYKGIRKALAFGSIMFFLGCAVGYFMVFPLALRFLATYNLSSNIIIEINLNSYIDTFMMLTLCMGLCFELPLVTWLLSLMGLLTRQTLRTYRRHAIVAIVIVAAVITPTGDPFTLTAVSLPLYLLYELSIFMVKDEKKEEEDEDDDDDKPKKETGLTKASATAAATVSTASTAAKTPSAAPEALEQKNAKQLEQKQTNAEDEDNIDDVLKRQKEAAEAAKKETEQSAAAASAPQATADTINAQAANSPTKDYTAFSDEAPEDTEVFQDTGEEYWHQQPAQEAESVPEAPAEDAPQAEAEPAADGTAPEVSIESADISEQTEVSAQPVSEEASNLAEPQASPEVKTESTASLPGNNAFGIRYDVSRLNSIPKKS